MSLRLAFVLCVTTLLTAPAAAREAAPPKAEVAAMVAREPISAVTWPVWRGRLLAWLGDRSANSDPAYDAARQFFKDQAAANGNKLPAPFADDAFAWYLLGSSLMNDAYGTGDRKPVLDRAEAALRTSLRLDGTFARTHRNLAAVLLLRDPPRDAEGRAELDAAHRLDPVLPLKHVEANVAMMRGKFPEAESLFHAALAEEPDDVTYARGAAAACCQTKGHPGGYDRVVRPLCEKFPDDGPLACLRGVALALDNNPRAGVREFGRARMLGTDPSEVLSPQLVTAIEDDGAPVWWEVLLWAMAYFGIAYAVIMLLMAFIGLLLATRTRGTKALELLGTAGEDLVSGGQVARVRGETGLAKLYVVALAIGLVLFYVAVPFVVVGLLGGTAGLLLLIFSANRIPVKLVILIVVAGLGATWAVLKSIFTRPAAGGFGILKSPAECPRLHALVAEVAGRIDTAPVDEIYLSPGASIGVHQTGRGPFGLFGVSKRVLTLGLTAMESLTLGELRSILAHEYAHFSHADTAVNRFVYQVSLSIGESLNGMRATGGFLNYVNPFYWFLVLYHKAYELLSAGYSRSREFLADRMAVSLYGPDVFRSGLAKVMTEGTLFESTIYGNIADLLQQDKSFINMYTAFRSYRDEQLTEEQRRETYRGFLDEKASLFATHPTFGERIAALEGLPPGPPPDDTPALSLFDDVEAVEKEMTEFLTAVVAMRLQAAAAQQG
ncbi:MAG: M48 family metalloprotease [Gemmataceae bacterium]